MLDAISVYTDSGIEREKTVLDCFSGGGGGGGGVGWMRRRRRWRRRGRVWW